MCIFSFFLSFFLFMCRILISYIFFVSCSLSTVGFRALPSSALRLHGLTLPLLSERNRLWIYSNPTWKRFSLSKTTDLLCFPLCAFRSQEDCVLCIKYIRVCGCLCVRMLVCALRIVSPDMVLRCRNTCIVVIINQTTMLFPWAQHFA